MTVAIIASGQSLNKSDIDLIKNAREDGKLKAVIAVSNVGLDLTPWADALVSHDAKWWSKNPKAAKFRGRKFCRNRWSKVEVYIPSPTGGCNSGYMAMQVARDMYKANRIILLGFDMHGTHYFGPHVNGLKNTTADRFKEHIRQFEFWNGCPVVNCTPKSALKKFPFMSVRNAIEWANEV